MNHLRAAAVPIVATLLAAITGCASAVSYEERISWDRKAADAIGIAAEPVTADQAMLIAEHSAGATAVSADRATERGTEVYAVKVQTDSSESGMVEQTVHVRVSDGAVMQIRIGRWPPRQ